MSRNYRSPTVPPEWADSRRTHIAVATAIHAIADSSRSPEEIWDSPTPAEVDHVTMAVEEYIREGIFPSTPSDRYEWGDETIELIK